MATRVRFELCAICRCHGQIVLADGLRLPTVMSRASALVVLEALRSIQREYLDFPVVTESEMNDLERSIRKLELPENDNSITLAVTLLLNDCQVFLGYFDDTPEPCH